jgi:hypothetical protein
MIKSVASYKRKKKKDWTTHPQRTPSDRRAGSAVTGKDDSVYLSESVHFSVAY